MSRGIGCEDLIEKLENLGESFEDISKEAINAALPTLESYTEKNLKRYVDKSDRSTGALVNSLYQSKARKNNKTGNIKGSIGFKGKDQNGVRNGLKAGVLEYGKKGQPP